MNEQTISYTLTVTVLRPVRIYDTEDTLENVADWMMTSTASRELEKEVLHALRAVDGDCDVEVVDRAVQA